MTSTDYARKSDLDRTLHIAQAKLFGGLSRASISLAIAEWAIQFGNQPARRAALGRQAAEDLVALWTQALGLPVEPLCPAPDDHRFRYPRWNGGPFALAQQAFLRTERWWHDATTGVPGVSRQHGEMVSFLARQMLDVLSPSNIPILNPEVIDTTLEQRGANLEQGFRNFLMDLAVTAQHATEQLPHTPGKDVAITQGSVVFRNELIELILYAPLTEKVRPEPILIVPAWIMKYYILDLSPENSFIRYMVSQGYTVFCISWLNPGAEQRDVHFDDYRSSGVMAALDAVGAICGSPKIHAIGYCLGGTLLSIAAAAMARDGDGRLGSLTLLAAQTDFTEAGELQLFITEAQLSLLDDIMWKQGYLDSKQMAGTFAMLRSNDLIWSRTMRRYYLGIEDHASDMMSWDADSTRMPYRMHSEYLRSLYLNNDLAEGMFNVQGRPVLINEIHLPCFITGAETDWVAPWRSVHKFLLLNDGEVTFVLASGGHNGGVVSVPGASHRHFRISRRASHGPYQSPEEWKQAATLTEGSWWPAFLSFLDSHSSEPIAPPSGYPTLEAAPGHYVLQR